MEGRHELHVVEIGRSAGDSGWRDVDVVLVEAAGGVLGRSGAVFPEHCGFGPRDNLE
jgi:hypothetical protein